MRWFPGNEENQLEGNNSRTKDKSDAIYKYQLFNFQQKAAQVLTDSNIYGCLAVWRKFAFLFSAHISSSAKYLFVNYQHKVPSPKLIKLERNKQHSIIINEGKAL